MKSFYVEFALNAKLIAIIYLCYEYGFSLSHLFSCYELYGDNTFFIFKILSCNNKIKITDNIIAKTIEQSRLLHKEILKGVSRLQENESYEINTCLFNDKYKTFIEEYFLKNIENLYSPLVRLKMDSKDLYEGLK